MARGRLEVSGSIELAQFWPDGESDADTTKIKVAIGSTSFRFQAHPGASKVVTHAFDNATVKGRVTKDAIDKKGRITVRLQAIDAPELHYRPSPPRKITEGQRDAFKKGNGNFRQPLAETATVELCRFLSQSGADPLRCTVVTYVDQPNEVFDTYGRFVGEILVDVNGVEESVNRWLARSGWAFPTFYSSMGNEEIEAFRSEAAAARKNKVGVWRSLSMDIKDGFDRSILYRKKGPANPTADQGPVLPPKVFRRISTWQVSRSAKVVSGSFAQYLAGTKDDCFETDDFLEQGRDAATLVQFADFVKGDTITAAPDDLVFREAPSKLVDENSDLITDW